MPVFSKRLAGVVVPLYNSDWFEAGLMQPKGKSASTSKEFNSVHATVI